MAAKLKPAAQKVGSLAKLRDALSKGGEWIIYSVPKDDSLVVRFLTEPEEWMYWDEVWDANLRKFYPVMQGWDNPDGLKPIKRYLANVLHVANDKVIALKLPFTLAQRLINRFDKYGTAMDRDYELERFGEGFDTQYEVTPEPPSRIKLSKYELLDLSDVLIDAFKAVHGDDDDDDEWDEDEDAFGAEDEGDEDDLEDEDFEDEDEEPEFEDDEDEEEDEDEDFEDEVWYADDLEEMNLTELRGIARELGVKTTKLNKDDLIEAILDAQGE